MKKTAILILQISISFNIWCQETTINVQTLGGFENQAIKSKLDEAIKILQELINNPEFKKEVLKNSYIRARSKSREEIFDLISGGQEAGTVRDNIINLKVDVYTTAKNEVGHTDDNNVIHTNAQYILDNSASCYASHLIHEYCHVLGFRHAFLRMPFRYKTVPYRMNKIVGTLLKVNCP